MKLVFLAYQLLRTARPRQWLKNFSLFAAPVLAGVIFDPFVFWTGVKAFLAFSLLSSGTYFINDIVDAPKDRNHPVKKNRPIASGKVSPKLASLVAILLVLSSLSYGYFYVGTFFFIASLMYIILQLSYSFYFRNIIILDSLVVASGFILRVFAGGLAMETSISSWLILTTIGLSLLLAFGKRRSEKTLMAKKIEDGSIDQATATRATLRHYPDSLLDSMISMSSAFCIISYSLFTFQTSPQIVSDAWIAVFPSILRSPKLMMITIPLVIYGVGRYLYVIYEKNEGESPARVLLSDKPLLLTVIVWGISVLLFTNLLPMLGLLQ